MTGTTTGTTTGAVTGARGVVVLGTGAFAGALVRSFAHLASAPATVHVVSRDLGRARDLCAVAGAHAALAGTAVGFSPHALDVPGGDDLRPLLARVRPAALVLCASDQSPAEMRSTPSAWTDLVRAAGFGVTLPLQAAVVLRCARASAEAGGDTVVINACFPDAVNGMVCAAGVPVLCGLGNVSSLAMALRAHLGVREASRLRLLAHHAHLHPPPSPAEEALAWLDDRPLGDVADILGGIRARPREHLNEMGAAEGGAVLDAVLHEERGYAGHVPGPRGLPGGYPVTITGRDVSLRLPPETAEGEAVAWNTARAELDGLVVDRHGTARPTPRALRALRRHWPDAPAAFGPRDLDDLRAEQLRLRRRLRGLPSHHSGEGPDTAAR
ncbi:potassium transporter TrkA [Microbispora sp. H10670]|uniref:potassium transporter TrkA n=1 Tax=Microbispora sp. H10670 TaxID=2729108 RepID=UPI0016020A15|nr:potassium transporter TrkA [Microbispora sp. H10670]